MKIQLTLDTSNEQDLQVFFALTKALEWKPTKSMASDDSIKEILVATPEQPTTQECDAKSTEQVRIATDPQEETSSLPSEKTITEEKPKTLSTDEWTSILLAKRKELGLLGNDGKVMGAPLVAVRSEFNDFVKEQCLPYGAELPKKLSPEALYRFVTEVFNNINYDPALGFQVGKYPTEATF